MDPNLYDIAFGHGRSTGDKVFAHGVDVMERGDYDAFMDEFGPRAFDIALEDARLDTVEGPDINDAVRDGLYEAWADAMRRQGEDVND